MPLGEIASRVLVARLDGIDRLPDDRAHEPDGVGRSRLAACIACSSDSPVRVLQQQTTPWPASTVESTAVHILRVKSAKSSSRTIRPPCSASSDQPRPPGSGPTSPAASKMPNLSHGRRKHAPRIPTVRTRPAAFQRLLDACRRGSPRCVRGRLGFSGGGRAAGGGQHQRERQRGDVVDCAV
jgi:hypothetical protein